MSDIEHRIENWRDELSQAESLTPDDLAELESHLRDTIDQVRELGLSVDEAFVVATCRLGEIDSLRREFHKTNGAYVWPRRVFWMLLGYVSLWTLGKSVNLVATLGAAAAFVADGSLTLQIVIALMISSLGWAGVAYGAWWLCKRPPEYRIPAPFLVLSVVVAVIALVSFANYLAVVALTAIGPTEMGTRLIGEMTIAKASCQVLLQLIVPCGLIGLAMLAKRRASLLV